MIKKAFLAVATVMAVICCLSGCSKEQEDSYRMIQVLEVSGTVTVERTDIGAVDAYEGMRLQSGDIISVEQEGWLKLQMDEDKYALVEPNSRFHLEASGNSTDNKTVIHLEAGAISSRLESELSDESVYEVNTPNSTMAVRGTVFRVEVSFDEAGASITNVSVYDGIVESRLVYPDGTIDDENKAVMIIDGTGVQIWGDDTTSDYVSTGTENDLKELQLETLNFLKEAYETGTELSVSKEELEELIAVLEENLEQTEELSESMEAETDPGEPESTEAEKDPGEPESTEAKSTETKLEPGVSESAGTGTPSTVPESTETGTTSTVPESTGSGTESTVPEEDAGNSDESTNVEHTVTFMYQGKVFATQTVQHNATVTVPKLQPTASGEWEFTFSTLITEDTTIEWVDSST